MPKWNIERGKVPHSENGFGEPYPFADMKPGDSVWFGPYPKSNSCPGPVQAARTWARHQVPRAFFMSRREGEGYRLWRVV